MTTTVNVHEAKTHFSRLLDTHTLRAGAYTAEHRDLFDRILAAQAELDGLTLVTRDPAFTQFKVDRLW